MVGKDKHVSGEPGAGIPSEPTGDHAPEHHDTEIEDTTTGDRDIDVHGIFHFGGGVALATVVVCALMWMLSQYFKSELIGRDPAPSPMSRLRLPEAPPAPRLQSDPNEEMVRFKAHDEAVLQSYGWVSKEQGVARIPIRRAIEILAEKGLGAARTSGETVSDSKPGGGP